MIKRARQDMRYLAKKTLYDNMKEKKSSFAAIEFLKRRDPNYSSKDEDTMPDVIIQFNDKPSQFLKKPKDDKK